MRGVKITTMYLLTATNPPSPKYFAGALVINIKGKSSLNKFLQQYYLPKFVTNSSLFSSLEFYKYRIF